MKQANDCPFCMNNNLFKGKIIASSEEASLTTNAFVSGTFLVIPKEHIEELIDLPDMWWADVKTLLPQVPGLDGNFNIALNYGKAAGQSIKHLHFWVVPRQLGAPSSGKGLAKLIAEADELS